MNILATHPTRPLQDTTASGVGWNHRWRLRFVRTLPLAALFGLAAGIKDAPSSPAGYTLVRFFLETANIVFTQPHPLARPRRTRW